MYTLFINKQSSARIFLGSSLHQRFFPLPAQLLLPRFSVSERRPVRFGALGFLRVQDGAALACVFIQLHLGDAGRLPLVRLDVGCRGVVLLRLFAQLRQLLELGGGRSSLEGSDGSSDAINPLLLVEDVVRLESVGLARGGVLETDSEDVFS